MSIINSYQNYVNSFYLNDVKVLKKRQKQAKIVSAVTTAAGAMAGVAGLMSPKAGPLLKWVLPALGFVMGASSYNYSRATEKKIAQLEVQA